ncbi:MAG: hypothetical protein JSV49_10060, partial [Thermoplasmata archaeon]
SRIAALFFGYNKEYHMNIKPKSKKKLHSEARIEDVAVCGNAIQEDLMGLDVLVIKLSRQISSLNDFSEDIEQFSLGSPDLIRHYCTSVFTSIHWYSDLHAVWVDGERAAIEFNISGFDEPTSLHLTLRMGRDWDKDTERFLVDRFRELNRNAGWQVFSLSDNSSLLDGL